MQNVSAINIKETNQKIKLKFLMDHRGGDRIIAKLPIQSVPITTDVVSSNLDQGEVYDIM